MYNVTFDAEYVSLQVTLVNAVEGAAAANEKNLLWKKKKIAARSQLNDLTGFVSRKQWLKNGSKVLFYFKNMLAFSPLPIQIDSKRRSVQY